MALAALNTNKRSASTIIMDNGVFMFGGHRFFRSPENELGGAMDMRRAIVKSSNVYFYSLANELGVDLIHDQMEPLGFGRPDRHRSQGRGHGHLAVDRLEAQEAYKRAEQRKWYAGETISLGMGRATTVSPCFKWRRPMPRWPQAGNGISRVWCARSKVC